MLGWSLSQHFDHLSHRSVLEPLWEGGTDLPLLHQQKCDGGPICESGPKMCEIGRSEPNPCDCATVVCRQTSCHLSRSRCPLFLIFSAYCTILHPLADRFGDYISHPRLRALPQFLCVPSPDSELSDCDHPCPSKVDSSIRLGSVPSILGFSGHRDKPGSACLRRSIPSRYGWPVSVSSSWPFRLFTPPLSRAKTSSLGLPPGFKVALLDCLLSFTTLSSRTISWFPITRGFSCYYFALSHSKQKPSVRICSHKWRRQI
jgi:hypothetical protein